MEQTRSYSQWQ